MRDMWFLSGGRVYVMDNGTRPKTSPAALLLEWKHAQEGGVGDLSNCITNHRPFVKLLLFIDLSKSTQDLSANWLALPGACH
jgi:hypothetical protein